MRKIITVFALMVLVTLNVMARPVTKVVYERETHGVILLVDTDTYGKDFKDADIDTVYGELKVHKNYFVWNVNDKKFEIGSAKGMDLWMDTFGDLFKYVDDLISEGYACANLIFVTDGFVDDQIKGIFTVTNSGLVYGYWEYGY